MEISCSLRKPAFEGVVFSVGFPSVAIYRRWAHARPREKFM